MSDEIKAKKLRDDVAESFERSDLRFAEEIKAASTATEFHGLLRKKLREGQLKDDKALCLRLHRHMVANKQFAIQEKERER